jgi:hypothetical protein
MSVISAAATKPPKQLIPAEDEEVGGNERDKNKPKLVMLCEKLSDLAE